METRQPAAAPNFSAACLHRLAPHLVPMVRRGIVGQSRYAKTLMAAIQAAAAPGQAGPVLISGEPGLEKDNIAALVHFGSPARHKLMVRLNCALLRPDGSDLFGSGSGSGSGGGGGSGGEAVNLLDCLAGGALLLDQIDRADPALRPALVELARTGNWSAVDGAAGEAAKPRHFEGRVFFTSERSVAELDSICQQIRVPPLRVRRQDLGEWVRYGVRLRSRSLGWSRPPVVSEALIKRLQTYDFPGNVRELMQLVDRALRQCASGHPAELPEDVFWIQRRSQRARFDLWRWKPQLRGWMRSPRFWNFLLFGLVSWVFVLVNVWLWLGPP
ncbi:MAG: sigma 54-interacting transcriptional regulator [Cyanobacteriota bacterium]